MIRLLSHVVTVITLALLIMGAFAGGSLTRDAGTLSDREGRLWLGLYFLFLLFGFSLALVLLHCWEAM